MLSRRPENPCSWGFPVFRIIAGAPFYLKKKFFEILFFHLFIRVCEQKIIFDVRLLSG